MEWTQEKIEKVQQELQKTFKRKGQSLGKPLWHEFLESFGVRIKHFGSIEPKYGVRPKCGEGELLFLDPYGVDCFLVIPKETAEKILVLGL